MPQKPQIIIFQTQRTQQKSSLSFLETISKVDTITINPCDSKFNLKCAFTIKVLHIQQAAPHFFGYFSGHFT